MDIAENIGIPIKESLIKSRHQTNQLLKNGLHTENHLFLSIQADHNGMDIGHIWVELTQEDHEAFIYHIAIVQEYRNQGYGKSAMLQLESYLKEMGLKRIRLNVFRKNLIAKRVYKKQGFKVTNLQMQKDI